MWKKIEEWLPEILIVLVAVPLYFVSKHVIHTNISHAILIDLVLAVQFLIGIVLMFVGLRLRRKQARKESEKELLYEAHTGLRTRASLNDDPQVFKTPHFLLYTHFPDLDDLAARFGGQIEYEMIGVFSKVLANEFSQLNPTIYRYRDHSTLMLVNQRDCACETIDDLVVRIGLYTRSIFQVQFPIPGRPEAEGVNIITHVGIVPLPVDTPVMIPQYAEYARFALQPIMREREPSIRVFDCDAYTEREKEIQRRSEVFNVISRNQITSVFQPILDVRSGAIDGYEALGRPTNSAFRHIGELLNDAEQLGQYINLEIALTFNALDTFRKLIPESVNKLSDIPRLYLNMAPETIKHNIYDKDIQVGMFDDIQFVFEIVERGEILPELIVKLRTSSRYLKAAAALDDFGTGYSNHLALLNAHPDIIKVSRELIQDIDSNYDKQQVYSNIVLFARNLQTEVLAEGVETEEEFRMLYDLGMDYCQGYFVGRPDKILQPASIESLSLLQELNG